MAFCAVLLLYIAQPALGQPAAPPPAQPAPPALVDPLGRDTPRGALAGFNIAVHRDDLVTAARHLQLTAGQQGNADELALDLNALIDRYFTEPINTLSNVPSGSSTDGLPLDREHILLRMPGGSEQLELVRVDDPQVGGIWLVSSATLARVPFLSQSLQASWIEQGMPPVLVQQKLLGYSLAHWIIWAASIAGPFLLFWALSGLVIALARRAPREPLNRALLESWFNNLRRASVTVLALIAHLLLLPFLGFTLRFRLVYVRFVAVAFTLALSFLIWRLMEMGFNHAMIMAQRRGHANARSLMLLGERFSKVIVVLITIFVLLTLAGVDTTAALAGVGIGGVAIALGAQKSVENLLGSVFLLSDRVLAVGDMCRIGDRQGWVEDITLRSVRLRTMEQSLLAIPSGALAQASIENFATRSKFLIQTTLRLRYGSSTDQLKSALEQLRKAVFEHPLIEDQTARVRVVNFSESAIEIELFAFVKTADNETFMAAREELLIRAAAIIESAGGGFARPSQFVYLDDQPDPLVASGRTAHGEGSNR